MPTLVSTGQITIVDNNDARPITAYITANGQTQQIYTKDDTTETFVPNWASSPLTLTAAIYVGGTTTATNVINSASLTNKTWSNVLGTPIATAVTTFTVSSNTTLTEAIPTKIYYFEADYTDPVTSLVSHVIAQITLSLVRTGTNATYVIIRGQTAFQESNTTTKNSVELSADLFRGSTVDDIGTTYKWFISPFGASDQLDANHPLVTAGSISFKTTAGGAATNPADGTYADVKTIVIKETAVSDIGFFKVEAKSADLATYAAYVTVYDVSDPYDLKLISTSGDKLQNGVGTTNVFPFIYEGSSQLTDTTGWTFDYEFYDATGAKAAFVDPSYTVRSITSNTTTAFTVNNTFSGQALPINSIVKVISTAGLVRYYEVAATSSTTVTIDTSPETETFANVTGLTVDQFAGGSLYVCQNTGTSITAGSFVVGVTYKISFIGTTSFTAIGASSNTVGLVFTATGVGTGTGTALQGVTTIVTAGSFVIGTAYTIQTAGSTDFTLIGAANSTPGTVFTATGVGIGTGTASVNTSIGVISKTGGTLANTQSGTHFTNSKIIVTGDDIDTKGTITCKAMRP